MDREKLLDHVRQKSYRPLPAEELITALIRAGESRQQWRECLLQLENEGAIVRNRQGRYGLPGKMGLRAAVIHVHPQGHGFAVPRDGGEEIYISAHARGGAMHRDLVLITLTGRQESGQLAQGAVTRILRRGYPKMVGRFEGFPGEAGYVIPDEKRLDINVHISPGRGMAATAGDKVEVEMLRWPSGGQVAEGRVIVVLGQAGEPQTEIRGIFRTHGVPESFPDRALSEAHELRPPTPETVQGRHDLRGDTIITIDGADAKDLDDAVSVTEGTGGILRLGVHIADVSHYIPAGSALDREALERGCSVYYPGGVAPMLPPALSSGICSLLPGEDRLTLTVQMDIDKGGNVVEYGYFESIIRSSARLTYDRVNALLDGAEPLSEAHLLPNLGLMRELRDRLLNRRLARGAIDLDLQESKITLDEVGRVVDVRARSRTPADSIIEEFMIVANETVAEHFRWLEVPFIYRVHEEPDVDRLSDLNTFLAGFGLAVKLGREGVHPQAVSHLLEAMNERPQAALLRRVLLRHMSKARYSHEPLGHFGLASRHYSHFTSPIRRYPDLLIHRIIKLSLQQGKLSQAQHETFTSAVVQAAVISSRQEQVAVEVERAVDAFYMALYMEQHIGQEYEGLVSGVTSFGFFVELENTVEGLVRLSSLEDDFYEYDPAFYSLTGRKSGRRFRLGDRVSIRVEKVNLRDRTIDFGLLSP